MIRRAISSVVQRAWYLGSFWANNAVPFVYLTVALSYVLANARQDFERNVLFHTAIALTQLTEK
ncbi:hypothetical protein DIPPA_08879 [Diplonema papillatum]|nr:hypothetical protein DIPPA_08879 [Diplonema papillatum]